MRKVSDISALRREIRKTIRHRRRRIPPEQKLQFSLQAAERMISWSPVISANNVAVFLSTDGELDTKPLIDKLWQNKKRVCLPVLHPYKVRNLLFSYYHPYSELTMNYLKVNEPKLDIHNVIPLSNLDILVVPLVAFDRNGHRLGMGGGFYDRVLKNWQQHNFQPVGYAYDCQLVDFFPKEKWDIPIPTIVTPSRFWFC